MWEGSKTEIVEVTDCVSALRVRAKSNSGVASLARLMARKEDAIAGHTSAGPLPVVTEIPEGHMKFVTEYFIDERNMTESEAEAERSSRPGRKWYAVVDGNHRHDALLWQADQNPNDFAGFPWRVHIIKWQPIRILKGFARARNVMQENKFLAEMTLYDTLRALKDIAIEEVLERGSISKYDDVVKERGFNKIVADGFCGLNNYADATVIKLTGVAKNLSNETIAAFGEIMTAEEKELMEERLQQTRHENSRDPLHDNRVYKDFVSVSALRGALEFRKAPPKVQVLALQRLKNRFPSNRFKGFSSDVLNSEAKNASLALAEKRKMEMVMGTSIWPRSLKIILGNLQHTSTLDEELAEYADRRFELTPSLSDAYKQACPIQGPFRIFLFSSHQLEAPHHPENDPGDTVGDGQMCEGDPAAEPCASIAGRDGRTQRASAPEISDGHQPSGLNREFGATTEKPVAEDQERYAGTCETYQAASFADITQPLPPEPPSIRQDATESEASNEGDTSKANYAIQVSEGRDTLLERGIQTHCTTAKVFGTTHFTQTSDRFDVYMGDPSQAECSGSVRIELTDEEIEGHVKMAKTVLFPGSVFPMFTAPRDFGRWCNALIRHEFNTQLYPFLFLRDEDYIQANRSKKPQNLAEFIVVAYSPGVNRNNFTAEISTAYPPEISTFRRRWAVMNKVPVPDLASRLMRPNTRSPLRPMQRSAHTIAELLNTFCRKGGNVLDVRSGAMETGVACMLTNRSCTLLESDSYCFQLAVAKLRTKAEDIEEVERNRRKVARRSRGSAPEELLDNRLHQSTRSRDRSSRLRDEAYGSDVTNDSDSDRGAENDGPLIAGVAQIEGSTNESYPDNVRGQSGKFVQPLIQEPLQSLRVQSERVADDVRGQNEPSAVRDVTIEGQQASGVDFNIPTGNIINIEATPLRKSSAASVEATDSMSVLAAVAERETREMPNTRKAVQTEGKSIAERIGNRRKRGLPKVRSGNE